MIMKPGYQPITRREIAKYAKRGDTVPTVTKSLYERFMNRRPEDNN